MLNQVVVGTGTPGLEDPRRLIDQHQRAQRVIEVEPDAELPQRDDGRAVEAQHAVRERRRAVSPSSRRNLTLPTPQ